MVGWTGNLHGNCLFTKGKLSDGTAFGHRFRRALNDTLIALGSTVLLEPVSEESLNQQGDG